MRKITRTVLVAAAVVCLASSGVSVAGRRYAPSLSMNRIDFRVCETDWQIFVTGAAPNTDVHLTEYSGAIEGNGSMSVAWGPANIGTTDGNGDFEFEADAPSYVAEFAARVRIGSDYSNPVLYRTLSCAPSPEKTGPATR